MFVYEKKLQYPVKIANPNPKYAQIIISQYGGPDGELGASLRYLSQRYSMPFPELKGLLTDVGVEELGHLEMIGAIVYQLTRNLTPEEIKRSGFDTYFVDHTTGVYPTAASGFPWTAASMQSKGDLITDLSENMAAEQKARTTYDNILRLSDDPDVNDVIRSNSSAKEKLFTSSVLVRDFALRQIKWTAKISTHSIRVLINDKNNRSCSEQLLLQFYSSLSVASASA